MQKNISHLGMLVCLGSMLTGCGIGTERGVPAGGTDPADCHGGRKLLHLADAR